MIRDDFLWVEKYRPATVSDCILPSDLKNTFQTFVDNENIPNLLLSGTAGVGKTSIAKAMLKELGCDYIIINGSMNGNIDTLRNEIQQYASSVSLAGGRKYVILDEADYLNAQSTQPALRNFMEEFSKNCGFILTCNFKNKIIEPLQSRCSVIDFSIPASEKPKMAAEFFKRVKTILENENVEYDVKVVAEIIKRYFPDFRKVLNELQRYGSSGSIDSGILARVSDITLSELINALKERNFTQMRRWVAENADIDPVVLFRRLYDESSQYVVEQSVPKLVIIIADYQYKNAFVADHEVNLVACLTEIMLECEFK